MKILRVIATMKPESGGPCQGIRNMVPELNALGVSNEVVCFDELDADYSKDPFPIHAIGAAIWPYAYQPNLASWLRQNLERFDVVIIHGLWLYNSYGTYRVWKSLQRKQKRIPKIYVMPHGMLDPYFQKAAGRRFKALRNWMFWKLLERKVVNGVDGILFTCEQELLLARQTFTPYHPKKELNVGYGVPEVPVYHPKMQAALKNQSVCPIPEKYMLFLSRIHDKKGVDLLIKGYVSLKEETLPDLVIAGPGLNSSYGMALQELAATSHKIHFTGMLQGDAKWGAFYNAEAFVLPSHQENFGIAVVEALACGTPVLISDQVNIWREIQEGGAGLVAGDTLRGCTELLQQWRDLTPIAKQELKNATEQTYQHYFSVTQAAKELKKILDKQLS